MQKAILVGIFFEKQEGARWLINFGYNARLRIPIPLLNSCVFFSPPLGFFCPYFFSPLNGKSISCSREQIQKRKENIQNMVTRLNYQIFLKVSTGEIQNSHSLLFPIFCIKSRPRGASWFFAKTKIKHVQSIWILLDRLRWIEVGAWRSRIKAVRL